MPKHREVHGEREPNIMDGFVALYYYNLTSLHSS